MVINTKLIYLGMEPKESKKTGKQYMMGKFMEAETSMIFEFYIPSDKLMIITELGKANQFTPMGVKLELTTYQGNIQVDLAGVQGVQS